MKLFRRKKTNRRMTVQEDAPIRFSGLLKVSGLMLAVIAVGALISSYLGSVDWERFRTLEISGELERVSANDVHQILEPFVAEGFAGIDLRRAQHSLEGLAWVADASVRRQWPGTLVVELREERPVATWFGTSLMNADGVVFVDGAAGFHGALPDIGGPAGTQKHMITRLQEVSGIAGRNGLQLHRLLRTERRAERLWLDNGIEVRLGRRDVDTRLLRFMNSAWPALRTHSEEIAYIDMRYTNGFAVGWKSDQASESRREKS